MFNFYHATIKFPWKSHQQCPTNTMGRLKEIKHKSEQLFMDTWRIEDMILKGLKLNQ